MKKKYINPRMDVITLTTSQSILTGSSLVNTIDGEDTGLILGKNCHDHEKVTRFYREYPGERVDAFYSDSITDFPMARLAERAYLILGRGVMEPWPERKGNKWG